MKRWVHAVTTVPRRPDVSKANAILSKYTDEQIELVRECTDDIKAEISRSYEIDYGIDNDDPKLRAAGISAITEDWLEQALEDDLLTEDEFYDILNALEILDTEAANAYA